MPIDLPKDVRREAIGSIKRYFRENMEEIGDLAAGLLLDFIVEEIGPSIYNQAVSDVQKHLQARLLDLDLEVHEQTFPYWQARKGR